MNARLFGCARGGWWLILEDGTEIWTRTEDRAYELALKLEVHVSTTTDESE